MDNIEFESLAAEFYRETGVMAPGKDVGAGSSVMSYEQRQELWNNWLSKRRATAADEGLRRESELSKSAQGMFQLIDEKTVTADDFNRFIAETSPTSINKRVQRQLKYDKVGPQASSVGREVDDKTDHEPADHNDPTTTLRGKSALRRQIKHNRAHPDQFREAIEFVKANGGKPLSECKDELASVNDLASLHKVVAALAQRPCQYDRKWLTGLDNLISGGCGGTDA